MALKAGIAWHLGPKNWDEVHITFVSDAKDRPTRPDKALVDNFEDYIPCRAVLDRLISEESGKHYPSVAVEVCLKDSSEDDLLQLCDVLLGATQMALVADSKRKVKVELGRIIVRWCEDFRREPWKQKLGLHRKFNVWAFPDDSSRAYPYPPLALKLNTGEVSLF